jgi:tripartite-type tricarboxylate transporter receptor subunit TctC
MFSSKWNRRTLLATAIAALCVTTTSAFAQKYPDKPIKIVVGFAAGGFTDVLARLIANKLQTSLGTPVVVENKAGATGTIGADFVSKSPADGYTLLMGHFASNSVAPSLFPKLPYDPIKGFTPIIQVASTPMLLVTNAKLPVKDVKGFIEYAKKHPDELSFASSGSGTAQHLAAAQFMIATNTKMVHIPYKGSGAAMNDLLGGQVQINFDSPPNVLPHIGGGKLNALAITSLKRSPLMPDVPTLNESGLKGFEMNQWFGIFAPPNLPKNITTQLNKEINTILRSPEVVEKIASQGGEITAGSSEDLAAFLKADIAKWAKVVKTGNITVE